eukprot:scaffold68317_cov42-Prasinocladus_malaysianus.AAC.2
MSCCIAPKRAPEENKEQQRSSHLKSQNMKDAQSLWHESATMAFFQIAVSLEFSVEDSWIPSACSVMTHTHICNKQLK